MSLIVPKTRTFKNKNRYIRYVLLSIAAFYQLPAIVRLVVILYKRSQHGIDTPIVFSGMELIVAFFFLSFAFLFIYMTEFNRLYLSPDGVAVSLPGTRLFSPWDNIAEIIEPKSLLGTRYILHLKNPIPIQHSPNWWPFQKYKKIPKLDLTAYLRPIDFKEFIEIMRWHSTEEL